MVRTLKKEKTVSRVEWDLGFAPTRPPDNSATVSEFKQDENCFYGMDEINLALDWNGHVELPTPMRPR